MAEARRLRRVLSGVAVGAGGVGYEQKLSAKPVEQRPPAAGLHWWSEKHLRAQRWPTAPLSPLPLSRTLSARRHAGWAAGCAVPGASNGQKPPSVHRAAQTRAGGDVREVEAAGAAGVGARGRVEAARYVADRRSKEPEHEHREDVTAHGREKISNFDADVRRNGKSLCFRAGIQRSTAAGYGEAKSSRRAKIRLNKRACTSMPTPPLSSSRRSTRSRRPSPPARTSPETSAPPSPRPRA